MGRAASKSEYDRQPGETSLEYTLRRARIKANTRSKDDAIVPVEAELHGDYRDATVYHQDDEGRVSGVRTKLNRGGSPVDRWIASGSLTEAQVAVIQWCYARWELSGLKQRVTANYGERIPGEGCNELRNAREIDARADLHRVKDYFPGPLQAYWDVFQNVCRFDMPAGVAGLALSPSSRSADARAHQVVCFVADVIGSRERI